VFQSQIVPHQLLLLVFQSPGPCFAHLHVGLWFGAAKHQHLAVFCCAAPSMVPSKVFLPRLFSVEFETLVTLDGLTPQRWESCLAAYFMCAAFLPVVLVWLTISREGMSRLPSSCCLTVQGTEWLSQHCVGPMM
jgi:hypothetical protein